MSKQLKNLSKASLAAVLASSALLPVAAVSADEVEAKIAFVVLQDGENLVKISVEDYGTAIYLGNLDGTQGVQYIQDTKGNFYDVDDYGIAVYLNSGDETKAFESLEKDEKALDLKVSDGKIVDGKVVGENDEQPEDRLNETLIYNFAA